MNPIPIRRQPNSRTISTGRLRSQGGSVIIETAITLMPLLAFVFATFDVAMAVTMQNTIQFAVRQGVRYAITSQVMSGFGHDASIKSTVITNTMGMMPYLFPAGGSTDPNTYITITYYNPTTLAAVTGVNSNQGGNICKISLSGLRYSWMGPLMRGAGSLNMSAASSDVMEASINGQPPAR